MEDRELEAIKQLLKTRLIERDRIELVPFTLLVQQNCEMAAKEQMMNNRITLLEAELNKARVLAEAGGTPGTVPAPATVSSLGSSSFGNNSVSSEEFEQLRNQLTKASIQNNENAQQIVDLTKENNSLQNTIKEKEKEIASLQDKCKNVETAASSADDTLKDKERTMSILRSELRSLQVKLVSVEGELRKSNDEKEVLVQRWLKKVDEEATMMAELKRDKDAAVAAAAAAAAEAANSAAMAQASSKQSEKTQEKKTGGFLSGLFSNQQQQQAPQPQKPATPKEDLVVAPSMTVPTTVATNLTGHSMEVTAMSFNLNGNIMVSCSQDKTIRLWDTGSWTLTSTLSGASQGVNYACINVTDDLVLGCSNDKAARLWNVSGGRIRQTLTGHQGKVLCGTFLGTSGRVVTSGQDKSLRVWDINRGSGLKTMICYSTCQDLTAIPNSSLVATAHLDGSIRLWDMTRWESFNNIEKAHDGHATCCTASPDGRWLLTAGRDNVLHIYEPTTSSVVATLSHPEYFSGTDNTRVTFSPDGHYIAAGSANGSIFVWDTVTMKHLHTLSSKTSSYPAVCVAWHPMISCIASSCKDTIDIWK